MRRAAERTGPAPATSRPPPPRSGSRRTRRGRRSVAGSFSSRACTTSSKKGESCGLSSVRRRGGSSSRRRSTARASSSPEGVPAGRELVEEQRPARRGRRAPSSRVARRRTAPAPRRGPSRRTAPVCESRIASSCSRATPRSMILTTWSGVISTFSGLRSRWTTPAAWIASSPARDLAADVAAELLGHGAQLVEQLPQRLPLDVLHDEEVCCSPPTRRASQSKHRTTFWWRTVRPISASRRNRLKKPGCSIRCGWTTFTATRVPAASPAA